MKTLYFWRQRPLWLLTGFFLLGVLTRIPFRSQMLYHWDSVNFALALERFDVRLHQPHPPGYIIYILLGWLVNHLVRDPNAAYVWLSVLFSGLIVAAVFALGWEMFGIEAGIAAGLFTLTSPAVWFYGEVALTYILEAFFVTVIALAAYRTLRGGDGGRSVWVMTALMGIAGGIRQTTLVLLLPLWLLSLARVSWRMRLGAAALLAGLVAAWLVPTVAFSGGLQEYLAAARAIGGGVISGFALLGKEPLWAPVGRLGIYIVYGLMGGAPLLVWWAIGPERTRQGEARKAQTWLLLFWLVPNLPYALLVRAPGHTFSFLPALLVLSGAGAATLRKVFRAGSLGHSWYYETLAVLLMVNVLFFLAAPPFLLGKNAVALTTPGRATICYRDRSLATRIAYIREHLLPDQAVILASGLDFRHPDFYLREYPVVRFAELPVTMTLSLPDSVGTVVLFGEDLRGENCPTPNPGALVSPDLCLLSRRPDQTVVVERDVVRVR